MKRIFIFIILTVAFVTANAQTFPAKSSTISSARLTGEFWLDLLWKNPGSAPAISALPTTQGITWTNSGASFVKMGNTNYADGKTSTSNDYDLQLGSSSGSYVQFTIPAGVGVGSIRIVMKGGSSQGDVTITSTVGSAASKSLTAQSLSSSQGSVYSYSNLNTTEAVTIKIARGSGNPRIVSIQVTKCSTCSTTPPPADNDTVTPIPPKPAFPATTEYWINDKFTSTSGGAANFTLKPNNICIQRTGGSNSDFVKEKVEGDGCPDKSGYSHFLVVKNGKTKAQFTVPNAGKVTIKLGGKLSKNNKDDLTIKVSTTLGGITNQEWKGVVYEDVCVTYEKNINSLQPVTFTLEDTQKEETFCILEIIVEKYNPVMQVWPPSLSHKEVASWSYQAGNGNTQGVPVEVEAIRLLDGITITAPAEFEISSTGAEGTFGSALTLSKKTDNTVKETIYVRLKKDLGGDQEEERKIYSDILTATTSQMETNGCGVAPQKSNNVIETVEMIGEVWLPVELISFTAQAVGTGVTLDWTTASEDRNDYFTLSRSANGVTFEELTRIGGAGTTTVMQHYSYNDEKPLAGISYYRLSQTDYDGSQSHSNIIPVQFLLQMPSFEIVNYAQHSGIVSLEVSFAESNATNYITVHSLFGTAEYERAIPAGIQSHGIELSLMPGVYVVSNVCKGVKKSVKIAVN